MPVAKTPRNGLNVFANWADSYNNSATANTDIRDETFNMLTKCCPMVE